MIILFAVVYPTTIWAIAQAAPNNGKGKIIEHKGQTYYENIGQKFDKDEYFWSRPSAVDYNAAGSGASNKGASNKEYLQEVEKRIETFLKHNPEIKKSEIPMDIITASGSGLDPNISAQAAKIQVKRISKINNIPEDKLQQIIIKNTEKPLFGLFGPEKINVFKLNIDLDQVINQH
jgi:K+-transporting ATPase ATPase C chain